MDNKIVYCGLTHHVQSVMDIKIHVHCDKRNDKIINDFVRIEFFMEIRRKFPFL